MEKEYILRKHNVKVMGYGTQHIIFAHGFGCDQNMWRFVTPAFLDNYRVVLFDFVGSGNIDIPSCDQNHYRNLGGFAEDVLDICDTLDIRNAIFVGHSVGATIGILASIRKPEYFEHLIMIGPSPRYINDYPDYIGGFEEDDIVGLIELMDKNYEGWANQFAPVIMGNVEQPELSKELEASFCRTDPSFARQFAKATFLSDYRDELRKVSVPSLILQCTEDLIAPLEVGAYVHHEILGSSLQLMEATGHCPHVSHPDETIQLISEYLSNTNNLAVTHE